jgi:hypothetical protein
MRDASRKGPNRQYMSGTAEVPDANAVLCDAGGTGLLLHDEHPRFGSVRHVFVLLDPEHLG